MIAEITSALTTVISWVGSVVTALVTETGALHALLPLLAIGIAISALSLGEFFLYVGKMRNIQDAEDKFWKKTGRALQA